MIKVRITSRLGNQLFQYAFAYAAAKALDTSFILEYKSKYGNIIGNYFRLHTPFLPEQFRHAYFNWKHRKKPVATIYQNGRQHPADLMKTLADHSLYVGYFQSLDYFSMVQQQIRSLFRIKATYEQSFTKKYAVTLAHKRSIVVHVRRADYSDFDKEFLGGKNVCLPDQYVFQCLARVQDLSRYLLIFISDDIDYARAAFSTAFPDALFEHNHEMLDLQLLMQADILIISNSTFAWWGAYLNPKEDKVVYTPRHWLGFKVAKEYPVGITPAGWTTVNVT